MVTALAAAGRLTVAALAGTALATALGLVVGGLLRTGAARPAGREPGRAAE